MTGTEAMDCDVAIIGAGPAGTVAGALLRQRGYRVTILERDHFPRFSIGESLLPQSMALLEEAQLLDAVEDCGFQVKSGATFRRREQQFDFDFSNGFTQGWGTTFQVERAHFDSALADATAAMGVDIRYGVQVTDAALALDDCRIDYCDATGSTGSIHARFCLDSSGFGRVLARLLNLDLPSKFPPRQSIFAHFEGPLGQPDFDINKILISTHPEHADIWYWVIPFPNNRFSVGVVGGIAHFAANADCPTDALHGYIAEDPYISPLVAAMQPITPIRQIVGYASDIKALYGDGFAILGNAGEFLDPVFSSGVTIALKSAALAVPAVDQALRGTPCDWEGLFAQPLRRGVNTFRAFVEHWYNGNLMDIFLFPKKQEHITRMMCSVLAGYAWDDTNPLNRYPARKLAALADFCT